ncbi:TylF/MycF family methyltransferase [Pseudoxanthomonas sp. LH2527]|uniref:TylF/MycF/NovP-related O-methyltransferase n=1 Tax=Pseudoxanthomonas sp. LH2527 TaxID=2923249 RepID=UPI001F1296BF|nr:TylF/MycF/NovP-related O-methyltransferase [Pseudoxanthomonas sp. LH2527]MCH6482980.1 TylF/MycF family methyltransferase [Pseudoxanthomonas sp. LH2527]
MKQLLRAFREFNRNRQFLDVPDWHLEILKRVSPFTMAGAERTLSTISTVEYVLKHSVPGSIVECGVWRGGQMMAAALALQRLGQHREIILFDTFAGMTAPGKDDLDLKGEDALPVYEEHAVRKVGSRWCEAGIDEVRRNLASTGYPMELVQLVQGPVETTIPSHAPERIAYLRLDTDWYESTLHEFEHLYPAVSTLGVIAIDDYGHWQGARKATDEYLERNGIPALLHRIDYTGRQFVKH